MKYLPLRSAPQIPIVAALAVFLLGAATPWEVHLRDGSVLHASIPIEEVPLHTREGVVQLRLSEVEEIRFADRFEPDLIPRIERHVRDLSHDDFHIREEASRALWALEGLAIPELREAIHSEDPEVKFRGGLILGRLEMRGVEEITKVDRILTSRGPLRGIVELGPVSITIEGREIEVPREAIERIRRRPTAVAATSFILRVGEPPMNSGLAVRKGDRIRVDAYGHLFTQSSGIPLSPADFGGQEGMSDAALLARVGSQGEEFRIGASRDFTAPGAGELHLRAAGEDLDGWLICKLRPIGQLSPAAGLRRLTPDAFGVTSRRIDFDRAPNGSHVRAGDNVEHLYATSGVILDTESPNSYVAADGYAVDSLSRGNSAANRDPRWTGDITVRFIFPGSFREAAGGGEPIGIRRCGVFVAAVEPKGTGLEAFDRQGRSIGKILTKRSGTDFLGLSSRVPIYSIRIFDVPSIDPNFAIDDLVFDLPASAAPRRARLTLRDGQRFVCRPIGWAKGALRVQIDCLGGPISIPEDRIDSISFGRGAAYQAGSAPRWGTFVLTNGDRISGKLEEWDKGEVAVVPWGGDPIRLPLHAIRGVEFPRKSTGPPPSLDHEPRPVRVYRLDGSAVAGSAVRLSQRWGRPGLVCALEDGTPEKIPLLDVRRISLAAAGAGEAALPRVAVVGMGGDVFSGQLLAMDDRRIHLSTPYADRISLFRSSIDRIEFFSR